MEDVLRVYERPLSAEHPVVCVDEVSRQLLGETRPPLAARPGAARREDPEYLRQGTFNVFLVFEPLTGWVRAKVTERRGALDWAELMREVVEEDFAEAERVVLVADNLNTHARSSLYRRFAPEKALEIAEKLEVHHTPRHGSWLNMAEIGLSLLSRQALRQRMGSLEEARRRVESWVEAHNRAARGVDWRFQTADARIKLKRLYPAIQT